ncbi:hypothetical protein VTH82DRAFT_6267 [Thermothelomyces myriococcoides]
MKFITAAIALAASAIAAPSHPGDETCKFGTYRCTTPNTGIEICDISGSWQLVGDCPEGTACNPVDGLPYCTVETKVHARHGPKPGDKCSTPGRYDCFGRRAIQVCDTQNTLQLVGYCPKKSHCDYLNGIPYCLDN